MPRKHHLIPRGYYWIKQIFGKAILDIREGVVVRKASAVDRQASERLLLTIAKARGFSVTRFGTHYIIHRPETKPETII